MPLEELAHFLSKQTECVSWLTSSAACPLCGGAPTDSGLRGTPGPAPGAHVTAADNTRPRGFPRLHAWTAAGQRAVTTRCCPWAQLSRPKLACRAFYAAAVYELIAAWIVLHRSPDWFHCPMCLKGRTNGGDVMEPPKGPPGCIGSGAPPAVAAAMSSVIPRLLSRMQCQE